MKGLIGFFDILGYQNFLKNNSATDSALEVLRIINGIPGQVVKIPVKNAKEFTEDIFFSQFEKSFKHFVFSDTIIFTLNYPEEDNTDWINRARDTMSDYSSILFAKMFKNGLPMRGVIHEGDFIFEEMCFAGKAIVEAYQLCESLNMSGLVFSEQLGENMDEQKNKGSRFDHETYFTYLTPVKNGGEKKLLNINWLEYLDDGETSLCKNDIENYVLKSFWGHKKDCSISVDIKVRNTVKVMRKMLLIPHLVDSV